MSVTDFPLAVDDDSTRILQHPALRGTSIVETFWELVSPRPRPIDCIQVEVTSRCTARCTYCPHTTESHSWKSRHMQAKTFANLWPLLQQTTRVHLQGWGEPFMHPHFFDFVQTARKAGCLVSTTSCGLYITPKIAEKIIKSGMDIIAFSLAGTDAESNAARAGADFDKVCNNIKLLQKVRQEKMGVHLEVHLAYIMLADRMPALEKLPALLTELEAHEAVVSTLDYIAAPGHEALALQAHEMEKIAQAKDILQRAAAVAQANGRTIHYALPGPNPCAECRENIQKSLYVDAEGTISPCIYLNVPDGGPNKTVFGNVNAKNAKDIWLNDSFQEFRRQHREDIPIEQCLHCVKKFEVLT